MLELWTNFIKHLDPTPSEHFSEVLGNVSWTQVRSLFEREVEEVFQSLNNKHENVAQNDNEDHENDDNMDDAKIWAINQKQSYKPL